MSFSQEFEELESNKRIRALDINGTLFIYNSKDSQLSKIDKIPENFKHKFIKVKGNPVKTLILHSTYECNLACKHCYIDAGKSRPEEMNSDELKRIVREFGELGGLGVDISGGEPLLKPGIEEVIYESRNQGLRTTVLTNASDLDYNQIKRIKPLIDDMAVGVDGLDEMNDQIRGEGSFKKIERGLEIISNEGIPLAITTLLTK